MKYVNLVVCLSVTSMLSACTATNPNMPLIFGQSHTVGVSIGGSAIDQGVELTLGYKDKDIAIVPVTVKQADGSSTSVKSTAGDGHQDALSVLGQFELNSDAKQGEVGLGKFFATGLAAKRLADGFAHKLGAPSTSSKNANPTNNSSPQ